VLHARIGDLFVLDTCIKYVVLYYKHIENILAFCWRFATCWCYYTHHCIYKTTRLL